jgi:RNA polymerase sigma-70 factor, ECF subfamily
LWGLIGLSAIISYMSFFDRVLSGDSEAVVKFYKLYSPKILSYLGKKLPRPEDAQELTNDVFLEAIDSLSMLEKENNISAWLYKIAHNKMVDFYRKKKIKSIILSQVPFLQIVANEVNQPEFQFEKNKIRDGIETALHSLPEKYRKILKLHYEEKISIKKIAVILDLSFKATESLLFRARQSFKLAYERTTISY